MEEYKQRLKRQNVLLWIGIVLLVVLDVLVGIFWDSLGFLDTRLMTERARHMQSMLLFGFLVYFVVKLVGNKRRRRPAGRRTSGASSLGRRPPSWRRTWPWRGWWWRRLSSACTTWTRSTPCITPWWASCCCGLAAGSMSAGNIDRPRRMCYNKQKCAAGAPGAA